MTILNIIYVIFNIILFYYFKEISNKIAVYDYSNNRKLHNGDISLTGGILVFISIFLYVILSNFTQDQLFSQLNGSKIQTTIFILNCSLFFLIGFIDDKKRLSSKYKFILFFLIIIIYLIFDHTLVLETLSFSSMEKNLQLNKFGFIFTLFCMIIFINAFNMYDGTNGQIGIYSIIILTYLSFKFFKLELLLITIPLIFFLILNFKSKTFIGNSGSYFLGFFFSVIIIKLYKFEGDYLLADEIALIMFYPVFDLLRLFIVRLKNNRNPLIGDRNHIHHYLLNKFHLNYKVQLFLTTLVLLPILIYEIFDINLIIILLDNLVIYFIIIKLKNSSFV